MTTPVIRSLRENFPDSHISILAKPWVAPVFKNNPYIDHIWIYDANGRHHGFQGMLRLAKDLRKFRFDTAILLQNAFEAAWISFLAGIPRRIGFDTDGRQWLLTHPVRCTRLLKRVHQVQYYLGILRGIGITTGKPELDLFVSREDQLNVSSLLSRYGISSEQFLVGINPGATYGTAKRWLPERFAELCRRIQIQYNAQSVILGSSGEKDLGNRIVEKVGNHCINLAGQTNLKHAIALIKRCNIFVTNDSGLMHIAAALDVPQIAIFGPTNHTTTSPASPRSRIIRVPTSCSPCLKPECPLNHHRCMKAITVDRVFDEVESILSDSKM